MRTILVTLLCASGLILTSPAAGAKPSAEKSLPDSVQAGVEKASERARKEQKAKLVAEAVAAVKETHAALEALEKEDTQAALAALERATGKLNILLARSPELELVPIDSHVEIIDVLDDLDSIEKTREKVLDLIEAGQIQQARVLIDDLASEIAFNITNLPLVTYPTELAAIAPLIDAGKIDEAKAALRDLLSTLVVTREAIPLPVLRAELTLDEAEKLVKKGDPDKKRVQNMLEEVRRQLRMAEALGYGDYRSLFKSLDKLEERINGDKSSSKLFASLKRYFAELQQRHTM